MVTLLVILVCVVCNALLAGYEVAFVTVSRPAIRKLAARGDARAELLVRMRRDPERTLSLVQIGITLLGALSAAVGGLAAGEEIVPHLQGLSGLPMLWVQVLAVALVVAPLTFVTVVAGELVPKALGLRAPLRVALAGARWARLGDRLLHPAVSALEWTTKRILNSLFPSLPSHAHARAGTALDIERLPAEHRRYVVNLVNIEHQALQDVLVPWADVVTVQFGSPPAELRKTALVSGHTRLPVCSDDRVVGILNTKELLAFLDSGANDWHAIVRPPMRIDVSAALLPTLRDMQKNRNHMSFVYAADGELLGVLTIEDILEEVVGEIYDEDDDRYVATLLASRAALRGRF